VPLTANDLIWVRSYIGDDTPPEDADLDAAYDRLGSPAEVVAEVLRKRLADLLAGPATFAVEGYSQNIGANIQALRSQLEYIEGIIPVEEGGFGARIVRLTRDAAKR